MQMKTGITDIILIKSYDMLWMCFAVCCRIRLLQTCCDSLTKCARQSRQSKRNPVPVVHRPQEKKMLAMTCHWDVHCVLLWHFQTTLMFGYVSDFAHNFLHSIVAKLKWIVWKSHFLANLNSCSCSLYVVVCPSVCRLSVSHLSSLCNVRAPYSADWNFRQCFCAM